VDASLRSASFLSNVQLDISLLNTPLVLSIVLDTHIRQAASGIDDEPHLSVATGSASWRVRRLSPYKCNYIFYEK